VRTSLWRAPGYEARALLKEPPCRRGDEQPVCGQPGALASAWRRPALKSDLLPLLECQKGFGRLEQVAEHTSSSLRTGPPLRTQPSGPLPR
jgi:hypothetical protein